MHDAAVSTSHIRAEPRGEARKIERPEAIMPQPANVGLEEGVQVRHAIFQHGQAVDAD